MKIVFCIVLGIALLGGLFYYLKPNQLTGVKDASSSQAVTLPLIQPKTFEIEVKNKKLVRGPEIINVFEGEKVIIKILVDEDEEFHLHGYDKSLKLEKDKEAELSFTADKTGRFPYELENSKIELGVIEVSPK